MSSAPNTNTPHDEGGWLDLLSGILSHVLDTAGRAYTRLFSALWPHVVSAWNATRHFVMAHPRLIALIILVLGVLLAQPLASGAVRALGFGVRGVHAGSIAAQIQSSLYRGAVPTGSLFSSLQSFGARQ